MKRVAFGLIRYGRTTAVILCLSCAAATGHEGLNNQWSAPAYRHEILAQLRVMGYIVGVLCIAKVVRLLKVVEAYDVRRLIRNWRLASVAALFLSICLLEPVVDASYHAAEAGKAKAGDSAMYALAGEFRSVVANLLWIKVERYHHEFIEKNPDYRQDKEIMPMVKLITDLDPHFVEAYMLGSWMLCMGMDRSDEGISYLKEAIKNNPDSMAVNEVLGTIYAVKLRQPAKAMPYLRRAQQLSADDWDRRRMRRFIDSVQRMATEQPHAATH